MKIEDLKIGDILQYDGGPSGATAVVKLVNKYEIVVEEIDSGDLEVLHADELEDPRYYKKPETRKLYAYMSNSSSNIAFNIDEYAEITQNAVIHKRAPEFDIEYKEKE